MKQIKGLTLGTKIFFHTSFVLFALSSVACPLLLANKDMINTTFNIQTSTGGSNSKGNMYFDTEFKNLKEVKQKSLEIIEETEKEGAVLLKNDNNALPLAKENKVSLYGAASYYSVLTGQGSGGISYTPRDSVRLAEGCTNAGLVVNNEMNEFYKNHASGLGTTGSSFMGAGMQECQIVTRDMPWSSLPAAKNNEADAAIMVIARNSGEAEDLYMDTTLDDGSTRVIVSKGKHNNPSGSVGDALALSANERDVLKNLKALKDAGTIKKIVVLLNLANPMQLEFQDDPELGVDACMWVGDIGHTGASAIGKLLTGEYNPSGRASDTFFNNSKYNPVYYNFGSIQYGSANEQLMNYFSTMGKYNNKFYVAYQEGIYNGYKYTETRYEDVVLNKENVGEFDYSSVVGAPFGYGLSYTEFKYDNFHVTMKDEDTYNVSVDVTNIGEHPGKEPVQIYAQKPYTAKDIENGIEKASADLVGYEKTQVLQPNQKETVNIEVKKRYLASYDADVEKTYVIGSKNKTDKYLLTAAKDSHDAVNNFLQYKRNNHVAVDADKMITLPGRGQGDANLVYAEYIAYDNETFSTNDYIEEQNKDYTPRYPGDKANYGVDKITNQFEDVDFKKANIFSDSEKEQVYLSRNNWTGTYGKRINLTANPALKKAQENPAVEKDNIPYPTYDEIGFYESEETFDEIKAIYLRGKEKDDPLYDVALDRLSFEESCKILQDGLRYINGLESINMPKSSQQNGGVAPNHSRTDRQIPQQNGFRGFAELNNDPDINNRPPVFCCNGVVASSFNKDLAHRVGIQTGEEAAWAGYNGIYGLGVNIHRGAYCGRQFEYYSEDGFLTGHQAGYEAAGLHKLGIFVVAKHAIINDQETHRAGLNVWANEQTIREVYALACEEAIRVDNELTEKPLFSVMTGMNRIGATWTGGHGFCNTVLRAEFNMGGYVVSDFNTTRPYMSPIQGVLHGNDMPDGSPANAKGGRDYNGNNIRFSSYSSGYGRLAWAMRDSIKHIIYTVVNSNTVNGITGDESFRSITPAWETAVPITNRVVTTIFIWSAALFGTAIIYSGVVVLLDKKEGNK